MDLMQVPKCIMMIVWMLIFDTIEENMEIITTQQIQGKHPCDTTKWVAVEDVVKELKEIDLKDSLNIGLAILDLVQRLRS